MPAVDTVLRDRRSVTLRLTSEVVGVGTQGSKENPTPVLMVSHSRQHNGCVAEKVACKADRVTPASCNKVALMAD